MQKVRIYPNQRFLKKVFYFIVFNFVTFGTRAMKLYPRKDRCKLYVVLREKRQLQ